MTFGAVISLLLNPLPLFGISHDEMAVHEFHFFIVKT